jgi:hypothetical protein
MHMRALLLVAAISVGTVVRESREATPSTDSYTFGGRVVPADGGSLDGVRVVAGDGSGSFEAIVDSSGVFVGSFPRAPRGRITLRVFSDSGQPRYHSSAITFGYGIPSSPTRIVLVPTRWRISGGVFDGREVDVDPVRATTRYGEATGFWRLTRKGRSPGRAVSWLVDSLPVRVAFRRERGDADISRADSASFWAVAAGVEKLIGRSLFRPASYAAVDSPGVDGILVTIDRRMPAAGRTFTTHDASGRIFEALVTVSRREFLGDPRVASHELLHALGFGHTGAWRSVMGANSGAINEPTVEDVAYAQLFYAISVLQREREAPFGILESGRE